MAPSCSQKAIEKMDTDQTLTLKVRFDKTKMYAWSLYLAGVDDPIKFSVPIFRTEAAAAAAGMLVLDRANASRKPSRKSRV
jgi:RNA binding exosome subunit